MTDALMPTVLATLAGILCGVVFSLLKLPIPAPPMFPGVMGVVGVYLGGRLAEWLVTNMG